MAKDFKLPLVGLGTCYYETLDRKVPLYLAGVTNLTSTLLMPVWASSS